MRVLIIAALCGALWSCDTPEESDRSNPSIRVATWNIEHLQEGDNEGPRRRTAQDFEQLAGIAARLDADIIALQEVENVGAMARVFPSEDYQFIISNRVNRIGNPIRTGFAVRRSLKVWKNGDYQYLDVSAKGYLRYGVDIGVETDGQILRLMSVHLKAFCFESNDPASSEHCGARLAQTEPLENWIDKRAIEGDRFIVLGDFNRRYDADGEMEWPNLDDGEPTGADLTRVTEGRQQSCNKGKYRLFIDHIVLGELAASNLVQDSFIEHTFDNLLGSDGKPPSDHCPLSIDLSPAQ